MSKFGEELIVSMKQAAAHSSGRKPRGMRVTKLEVPDVKPSAAPCACRKTALRWPIEFRFRR